MKYAGYNVLSNNNILVITADEEDAFATINGTTNIAIVILVIILVISVIAAYIFGKKLAKPLVDLSEIVDKIRQVGVSMSNNSKELNVTSEQTLAANDEISKAVEDVAEGSTQMANSISDINDNLGDMSSETSTIDLSVADIKQQTLTVQDSSDGLTDVSAANAAATQQMNANIEELNAMMYGVAGMASQMQNQSKELNNVLQFFK